MAGVTFSDLQSWGEEACPLLVADFVRVHSGENRWTLKREYRGKPGN